jgi:hypothetical protein
MSSPKITNQTYEFRPPDGDPDHPILIHGLQEDSPGQSRKVDIWKVTVPPEYAAEFGNRDEFGSYGAMVRALAGLFCGGDENAAANLLTMKQ